jgi:4-amino-4-deoxy-L-arabinose transferase-like glycosyltransferase
LKESIVEGGSNFKEIFVKNQIIVLFGVTIFVLAFALRVYGLSSSPDIFGDEVLYTNVALKLPQFGHLVALNSPWFIHPPMFYVLQSIFFQLTGISGLTLTNVFNARLTSCLYASLAVVAVFVWIAKISEIKVGAATAFVLMLEPYALKYSRMGLLESLVMLFAIVALVFFDRANSKNNLKNYVVGGIFFGLAMLTKEVALFVIVIIAVYWLLTKFVAKTKINVKGTLTFIATGLVMYLGYVIWALSIDASSFLSTKYYLLERVLWIVRDQGYTTPGYSTFASDFISTVNIYLITYILIGVATFASAYFLARERNKFTLLLTSWFIGALIFFGSIGAHNSQFFIYITIPAAIIAGYIIAKFAFEQIYRNKKVLVAGLMLLLVVIGYNTVVWVFIDGGNDTAVSQSINWIQTNIANGEKIWVPQFTYLFLSSNYQIVNKETYSTLNSIQGQGIHYFITSPRWTYLADNSTLNYIRENGTCIAVFYGQSTKEIDIYYVSNPL